VSTHIRFDDGSSWPRPALESDEEYGIGHRLRYARELTSSERMEAASVIAAYGYLIVEMTQERRNKVCAQIKSSLAEGVVDSDTR